jgi:hypothetical protein
LYADSLKHHGCSADKQQIIDWLALDIELNAQGIGIWLDRST